MYLLNCARTLLAASAVIGNAAASPMSSVWARSADKSLMKRDCPLTPKVFIIDMVRLIAAKLTRSF